MIDAIIFDVDGTLWDSRGLVAEAWNQAVIDETGASPGFTRENISYLFGKTMKDIADNLFPELEAGERYRLADLCFRYEDEWLTRVSGDFYPGVRETLPLLAEHYPLYIVSNCQKGYIEQMVKYSGCSACFSGWVSYGDTQLAKSDNLRYLMERHGLESPIYVGDTQGDWEACQRAGIPMIFAAYGLGRVEDELPVIHSFAELKKWI